MRRDIHSSQGAGRARTGSLLFSILRPLRKPDQKENISVRFVRGMRNRVSQIQSGDSQNAARNALLFFRVLVRVQPGRAALSLGRRSARTDEPSLPALAQSCTKARQGVLSALSLSTAARSASHPTLRQSSRATLRYGQWLDALPCLPRWIQASGDRTRRGIAVHRLGAVGGVGC